MQKTIRKEVSLSGLGLHTGKNVTMTFQPAPENTGICFRRIDLPEHPSIQADVMNVTDISRGTTIESKGNKIHTVEHTLAALSGL